MTATRIAGQRVLVIDDDPKFCALVSQGLAHSGFSCSVANDGAKALAILDESGEEPFDVVLLDIMMPQMPGWDVLARIRERDVDIPVIFVTAREAVEERVRGLQTGADDYIIKPFALVELLARIAAVVRRRRAGSTLRLHDLRLDLIRRLVWLRERPIDLSPKEFDLLRLLVACRNRVVSRRELLRDVWQCHQDPGTNVVEVHIARLRRKLAIARGPWVRTVRGKGYTLSTKAG